MRCARHRFVTRFQTYERIALLYTRTVREASRTSARTYTNACVRLSGSSYHIGDRAPVTDSYRTTDGLHRGEQ
jgi:hypothetical protein